MPKLNTDQIISRLEGRIAQLEAGEEVAKKDILVLLTDAQQRVLEDALAAQVELKTAKRPRTEEEKKALGWKSIREVRLEVLKIALIEANAGLLADFERRQKDAEIRQMRIYCSAVEQALNGKKDLKSAKILANNELIRAGLPRMDGQKVSSLSKRDKEVAALEGALLARFKSELSAEERETLEMCDKADRPAK